MEVYLALKIRKAWKMRWQKSVQYEIVIDLKNVTASGERQDLVKMLRVLKILECHCLWSTVAVLELFDFSSFYNLRMEWEIKEIFLW